MLTNELASFSNVGDVEIRTSEPVPAAAETSADFQESLSGLFDPHVEVRHCEHCEKHTLHVRHIPKPAAALLGWGLLAVSVTGAVAVGWSFAQFLGALTLIVLLGLGRQFVLPALANLFPYKCQLCRIDRQMGGISNKMEHAGGSWLQGLFQRRSGLNAS